MNIKNYVSLFKLSAVFLLLAAFQQTVYAQAPANDNPSGAIQLTLNTDLIPDTFTAGTTINATNTSGVTNPTCNATGVDDEVWYTFTTGSTPENGYLIKFTNFNANTTLNAGIYTGSVGSLTYAACNGQPTGILPYPAGSGSGTYNWAANTTYYIRVYTTSSNQAIPAGATNFNIGIGTFPPTPVNNDAAGAINLTVNADTNCVATLNGTTYSATQTTNEVAPIGNGIGLNDDIWYTFNTGAASNYQFKFTNTDWSMTVALYQGAPGSLSPKATIEGTTSPTSTLNFTNLSPYSQYYARIYTGQGSLNRLSNFNLCIRTLPSAPSNDEPSGAISLYVNPDLNCGATTPGYTFSATASGVAAPTCNFGVGADDDVWYRFTATGSALRVSFSNVSLNPDAMGVAIYTNSGGVYTPISGIYCSSGASSDFAGLTAGTQYYLRVYSIGSTSATYATYNICLGQAPGIPVNDNCSGAVQLPVTNGFGSSPVIGNLFQATSEGTPVPSCQSNVQPGDVWYKVTIPTTGNVVVQTSAFNTTISNLVMVAYQGTCGALTEYICDDDSNPDSGPSANHARISLNNQVAGSTVYFRVLAKGNDNTNIGEFVITAWDPTQSVYPPISTIGTCAGGQQVAIAAGNGNLYKWTPLFDNSGNVIAEIYPNGNALGGVKPSIYIHNGATVRQANNIKYLNRNVSITPDVQPVTPVYLRVYLLNSELTALTTADPSVINVTNLNVSRTEDVCQAAVGGTDVVLPQTGSSLYANGAYVQFTTNNFSSFYMRGGFAPLPVKLLSFTGKVTDAGNQLEWTTTDEKDLNHFELERSEDGIHFSKMSSLTATGGASLHQYTFTDAHPIQGNNYYRLILADNNVERIISNTVTLISKSGNALSVAVFPNPANNNLNVNIAGKINGTATIQVVDIYGRTVKLIHPESNTVTVDISDLTKGTYFVKYLDNTHSIVTKVIKH